MSTTIAAAEIDGRPSHDDLQAMLSRVLNGGTELYGPAAVHVIECGDGSCVVRRGEEMFRYPYTVSDDGGSVTLGTPVPVRLSWRDLGTREPAPGRRTPARANPR